MARATWWIALLPLCACEDLDLAALDESGAADRFAAAEDDTGESEDLLPGSCDPTSFLGGEVVGPCCQDGNRSWIANPERTKLGHRTVGTPCTLLDGSTNCGRDVIDPVTGGFVRCDYGPCGGLIEWVLTVSSTPACPPDDPGCRVHVYMAVPGGGGGWKDSDQGRCGWEALDIVSCANAGCAEAWHGESTLYAPDPYEHQPLYEGLVGTCPYAMGSSYCLSGGRPMAL